MLRITLTALITLSLGVSTAQASPYASSVRIAAAPGYAEPGAPAPAPATAPAPAPAPAPYGTAAPAPAPYGQPAPYAEPQPYAQPQPYGPPQPYQQPPRRRGKGMMIAGWTIFGASYLSTALVGAFIYDASKSTCDDLVGGDGCRRNNGLVLFVPVVGPLIGIGELGGTATGTIAGIFSFLAQGTGLGLGIAGTVLFVRDGKRQRAAQQAGLHIGRGVYLRPAPRLDGGGLQLNYRF
jgi:hypothetical protein